MLNILLADNEPKDVSDLIDVLGSSMDVTFAVNGEEAIQYLYESMNDKNYDVFITDYHMDILNGDEVLEIIDGNLSKINPEIKSLESYKTFRDLYKTIKYEREKEKIQALEEIFPSLNKYKRFVEQYKQINMQKIMFSGSYNDGIDNINVHHIQKGEGCEKEVIDCILERGMIDEAEYNGMVGLLDDREDSYFGYLNCITSQAL